MIGLSERLLEQALDLLWSLWTELGVSGWGKAYPDCAVDPEPLILFTAALGDADPRLRDEATDWCIKYGCYISGTRLRNLLNKESESAQKKFGEFAATVAAHSKQRWPGATSARKYRPTGRSQIDDFSKPPMIVLRLRALLGVSARADAVKVFLSRPGDSFSASDIAGETNFTKRHVATALESLRMGGLLESLPLRNQVQHQLRSAEEVLVAVGSVPRAFPNWVAVFHCLGTLVEMARRVEKLNEVVREVEVKSALNKLAIEIRAARLPAPPNGVSGAAFWPAFTAWVLGIADRAKNAGTNRGWLVATQPVPAPSLR